ncbi:uncharacterized protein LAESUDRAFT_714181 [Laetiporus sulphureus 93-53]|uniref:Uncharacterized protein n=1 Tax=Laetiporus sulphureus 93-53 TaxID=1314785 RepID=A0A165E7S3_9APHY|nr:uncharacterized protein LAESUDRAFT_714181 [Laetiporus sulphureus 93-53]KZT06405.1 hypothetical protein LAESUDRAFT_714181 [Laetiporus sulphureus 93-53]
MPLIPASYPLRLPSYRSSHRHRFHPYSMAKRPRLLRAQTNFEEGSERTLNDPLEVTLCRIQGAVGESDDDVSPLVLDVVGPSEPDLKEHQNMPISIFPPRIADIIAYVVLMAGETSQKTRGVVKWLWSSAVGLFI